MEERVAAPRVRAPWREDRDEEHGNENGEAGAREAGIPKSKVERRKKKEEEGDQGKEEDVDVEALAVAKCVVESAAEVYTPH